MTEDLMISGAEIEALAARLDGLDTLSARERLILTGVFVLAGQAAGELTDEVSGFMPTAVENSQFNFSKAPGLPGYLNTALVPAVQKVNNAGGLMGGFNWGMAGAHGAGGGGAG